jgi:uncharacterized protein (TIGR03435 family)
LSKILELCSGVRQKAGMIRFGIAALCLAASTFAQTATPPPAFEAVAIKPAAPSADGRILVGIRGGPDTPTPRQMNFWNVSLADLIQNAWDVKRFQVSGPDWLSSNRFDISAKVPEGATKEQARVMMQNMLAERFRLALHHSTKESSIYALVVAKGGPKLREAEPGPAAKQGRMMMMDAGGRMQLDLKGANIGRLIDALAMQVDRPVVDMTSLTGTYDVALEFAPDPVMMAARRGGIGQPARAANLADPDGAPTIFSALTDQLGLRLESRKGPVEILVIDSVEKDPTAN